MQKLTLGTQIGQWVCLCVFLLTGSSLGLMAVATTLGTGVETSQDAQEKDEVDPEAAIGSLDNQAGIDLQMFDSSVRIQDDLFRHVNGTWLDKTAIPSDKSNYGSFTALADISQKRIRKIIESAAANENEAGSDADKVGKFYQSFMNTQLIEDLGVKPLQDYLDKIQAVTSKKEMLALMGQLQVIGVDCPLGIFVGVDNKDSTRYLVSTIQSGTTLPDRDFYLQDEEKFNEAKDELVNYIDLLNDLAGIENPEAGFRILQLEAKLAEYQWSRVAMRDANARYNKYAVSDLKDLTGDFDWKTIMTQVGVGEVDEINVITPSYFEKFAAFYEETSLDQWKEFMTFKVLDGFATSLSKDFVDAHFHLHDEVLAGIPEQEPRWKRGVAATAGGGRGFGVLGESVGKLYVEKHFKLAAKARMEQLVANLMEAYKQSIDDLKWMTQETKAKAQEKLSKFTTKIGYPNKWRDYSKLEILEDDLVGNLIRSAKVEHHRMIDRLGKPVDRELWGMTPQTVNAYYNPTMNEIVFPAAILQPPFFNQNADDAVNYGGIGAVIGHEISHGFDDQGSKYDGDGNLNNWWTDSDREAFSQLTQKLINQYADYEPLPGKNVNGNLTLGENIADLSGLTISFKAYNLSLEGQPSPEIAGWTGEQRFFLGWSQVWRRKYREAEMMQRLLVDPHSPSSYRANGPVTNIDAFQKAFELKPGDALYKTEAERIQIW